jgi:hypothetical protein
MQCSHCGGSIPHGSRACPSCGHPRSRLIYLRLFGVAGGILGSLAGFTLHDLAGAFLGGLVGIVAFELAGWLAFRPRPTRETRVGSKR